jgi:hypothetical protein
VRGMSRYLVDRIEAHERIAVRTRTHVTRVEGGEWLQQVVVAGPDGDESIDANGMFVLIGGEPLTAGVEDWLRCDAGGYLMTGSRAVCPGRPQLVAAGTRPSLSRIEPTRAVRRGRRSPRIDQASRVGRRRRRNVDRAGAQLPGYAGPRSVKTTVGRARSFRVEGGGTAVAYAAIAGARPVAPHADALDGGCRTNKSRCPPLTIASRTELDRGPVRQSRGIRRPRWTDLTSREREPLLPPYNEMRPAAVCATASTRSSCAASQSCFSTIGGASAGG